MDDWHLVRAKAREAEAADEELAQLIAQAREREQRPGARHSSKRVPEIRKPATNAATDRTRNASDDPAGSARRSGRREEQRARIEALEARSAERARAREAWSTLLAAKEREARAEGGVRAKRLDELNQRIADLEQRQRELDRVGELVSAARRMLTEYRGALWAAEERGTDDILGTLPFAEIGKHRALSRAREVSASLQSALRALTRELRSKPIQVDDRLPEVELLTAAEIVAESLGTVLPIDLWVQARIERAQERASTTSNQIGDLRLRLQRVSNSCAQEFASAREQREAILFESGPA